MNGRGVATFVVVHGLKLPPLPLELPLELPSMEVDDGGAPGGEKVAGVLDKATPEDPPDTEALPPNVAFVVVIPRAGVRAAKLLRSGVIVRKAGACAFGKAPAAVAVPGARDEVAVGA